MSIFAARSFSPIVIVESALPNAPGYRLLSFLMRVDTVNWLPGVQMVIVESSKSVVYSAAFARMRQAFSPRWMPRAIFYDGRGFVRGAIIHAFNHDRHPPLYVHYVRCVPLLRALPQLMLIACRGCGRFMLEN
jgi:hypothetical protein